MITMIIIQVKLKYLILRRLEANQIFMELCILILKETTKAKLMYSVKQRFKN